MNTINLYQPLVLICCLLPLSQAQADNFNEQVNVLDANANNISWLTLDNDSAKDWRVENTGGALLFRHDAGSGFVSVMEIGAGGSSSTALGIDANASGGSATAVGIGADATAANSTAVGRAVTASGIASTAVGVSALASGNESTAVGFSATASAESSTAVGLSSRASGSESTALGRSASASGASSTAVGRTAVAQGDSNTTLGYNAVIVTTLYPNATAIGARAQAEQSNALVLGSIPGLNGGTDFVDVGIGTSTPAAPLHIQRSTSSGPQEMFRFTNTGGSFITWEKTTGNQKWFFTHENAAAGRFIIDHQDNDGLDGPEFALDTDGNITVPGAINAAAFNVPSDRNLKQDINALDGQQILARLEQMPVSEWRYKSDPDTRHIGPMAQDFHAAFGLGQDDKHISPTDMAGVALAAVKAVSQANDLQSKNMAKLQEALVKKNSEIAEQQQMIKDLQAGLVQAFENMQFMQTRLQALESSNLLVQAHTE